MGELTDDALIERTLGGDRASYDELVQRHVSRVYAYVRSRVPSVADADELAQDAFVEAYLSLENFRLGQDFSAWCRGIARNLLRDRARRLVDRHERRLAEVCASIDEEESDVSPMLDTLEECLGRVDEASRLALELFYQESKKLREIAQLLSRTPSWVGVALHRTRKQLRLCIEQHGGWRA
jgi:RNA polymerase sigma-70 factor (ECF subfamily)